MQYLEIENGDTQAYSNLGECYLYIGDKEKCLEYLNKSKEYSKENKSNFYLYKVYGEYYIENVYK